MYKVHLIYYRISAEAVHSFRNKKMAERYRAIRWKTIYQYLQDVPRLCYKEGKNLKHFI